jgi:hypothetical protein
VAAAHRLGHEYSVMFFGRSHAQECRDMIDDDAPRTSEEESELEDGALDGDELETDPPTWDEGAADEV